MFCILYVATSSLFHLLIPSPALYWPISLAYMSHGQSAVVPSLLISITSPCTPACSPDSPLFILASLTCLTYSQRLMFASLGWSCNIIRAEVSVFLKHCPKMVLYTTNRFEDPSSLPALSHSSNSPIQFCGPNFVTPFVM